MEPMLALLLFAAASWGFALLRRRWRQGGAPGKGGELRLRRRHPAEQADQGVDEIERSLAARKLAGMVDGRHFSTYGDEVRRLMRARDDDVAAGLVLRLVEAVEREATIPAPGGAMPLAFHRALATIYRRQGMAAEAGRVMQRGTVAAAACEREGQLMLARLRQS
jgi:hypothetical protein